MNKAELIDAVAGKMGDRRTAATAVEAVLSAVQRTVSAGEKVALSGFGVFEKVERAARSARNPATGATVQLAATSVPRFRAGQGFRDVVRGARELPDESQVPVPRTRTRAVPAPPTPPARPTPVATTPAAAKPAAPKKAAPKKVEAKKVDSKKDAKKDGKKVAKADDKSAKKKSKK